VGSSARQTPSRERTEGLRLVLQLRDPVLQFGDLLLRRF
jgi:hypothetical protein